MEIFSFKKKEMIPLANKEINSYDDKNKKSEYDLYHKVRDHCHYIGKFR